MLPLWKGDSDITFFDMFFTHEHHSTWACYFTESESHKTNVGILCFDWATLYFGKKTRSLWRFFFPLWPIAGHLGVLVAATRGMPSQCGQDLVCESVWGSALCLSSSHNVVSQCYTKRAVMLTTWLPQVGSETSHFLCRYPSTQVMDWFLASTIQTGF